MITTQPSLLSDAALVAETVRAAGVERQSTADLLALLAELDTRRLYLAQGYPSLFVWCTQALHLSEPAAYSRITAARVARRFPIILERLADGDVTLTTISLLAAHLTDENHDTLLESARRRSKREVERLVACVDPQPDVTSSVRRAPALRTIESRAMVLPTSAPATVEPTQCAPASMTRLPEDAVPPPIASPPSPRRAGVAQLAADRYLLKVTLSREAHARLERIRALLRHTVPNGDPAVIVDRALTALLAQLEKAKNASVSRGVARPRATTSPRHVPAAVRRAVWARDDGRCAFVGTDGRCRENGFLEFHHVVPFARGGPANVENLQLRCRAHNAYEAERDFGGRGPRYGERPRRRPALSGQSPSSTNGPGRPNVETTQA